MVLSTFAGTVIGLAVIGNDAAACPSWAIPRPHRAWTTEQRWPGLGDRGQGVGPQIRAGSGVTADRPVPGRAFRPANEPFEFAIVPGCTLPLGSTEPEALSAVAATEAALGEYLGASGR